MITCPVCLAENDDFATTCTKCKAFLQNRVPNLDLFQTAWKILESPRATFRQIVLAEHKNFSLLLFALFGINLSFTAFWYFKLGSRFDTLLDLLPWALLIGLGLGAVTAVVLTLAYHVVARILGGAGGWKDSMALLAYSLIPIAISLLILLPIELLTFGMYFFTSNPPPYTLKPVSYVLLVGIEALLALWSFILVIVGTKVGHRLGVLKSILVVVLTVGLFGGGLFFAASHIILRTNA